MKLFQRHTPPAVSKPRAGFTLIELLVVIAIIGVLVALITAAVMRVRGKQPEIDTFNELRKLSEAADNFKSEFGIYPPSKFVLYGKRSDYLANVGNPLVAQSLAVLDKMFPGVQFNTTWGLSSAPSGLVLEGDQCLVFFLGGISGDQGFAKGADPAAPKSSAPKRIGPFFEFKRDRQFSRGGHALPSYKDAWSSASGDALPYLFFSSGQNGRYNGDHKHLNVLPYWSTPSPKKYYHESSVQIISAGRDRKFGPGGLLNASNPANPDGQDDQVNFKDTLLGVQ